jgi:hypothetical protein
MKFAEAYGNVATISGAFESTVGGMADYQEDRFGADGPKAVSQPISSRPRDERVTLCYYDGTFNLAKGPPPGADGEVVKWEYVRLSVLVFEDGSADLDSAQISSATAPTGPTSSDS